MLGNKSYKYRARAYDSNNNNTYSSDLIIIINNPSRVPPSRPKPCTSVFTKSKQTRGDAKNYLAIKIKDSTTKELLTQTQVTSENFRTDRYSDGDHAFNTSSLNKTLDQHFTFSAIGYYDYVAQSPIPASPSYGWKIEVGLCKRP